MNQIAPIAESDSEFGILTMGMAPGLAIMFNTKLYSRCKEIATNMSEAGGVVPPHLIGKPVSCFAVLTRSITWKLDPFAVAQSTYETPGGKIGYEGKLIQAILEQSGKLDGPVKYQLFGEWQRIRGKFRKAKSDKGKDYFVPGWDPDKDEDGLGVIVSAQVRGEAAPRSEEYLLRTFWPRNSTLWALRPEQQIKYAAARAFANTAMPGILMGIPFDMETSEEGMKDVTPARPKLRDFENVSDVDWNKAGEVELQTEDEKPAEVSTEQAAEETPEFGHKEARDLGLAARDAGRALASVPADLAPEYHDAYQDGWRARDDEITAEKKAAKKG